MKKPKKWSEVKRPISEEAKAARRIYDKERREINRDKKNETCKLYMRKRNAKSSIDSCFRKLEMYIQDVE